MLDTPTMTFLALHDRLSLREYRMHYPTAHLMSLVANAMGGKGDGKDALPAHKRFEPEEFLPGYAQPSALTRDLPFTPEQCGAILAAIEGKALPSWALQMIGSIMPMTQVIRHGRGRQPELGD